MKDPKCAECGYYLPECDGCCGDEFACRFGDTVEEGGAEDNL